MAVNPALALKLGMGGIINGRLITFDYMGSVDRIKPYLCRIEGRCFKYKYKREFVRAGVMKFPKKIHERPALIMTFDILPNIVYEYKRFMGPTLGEVVEGYFAVTGSKIYQLEEDELDGIIMRTREKLTKKEEVKKIYVPQGMDPDDVPF